MAQQRRTRTVEALNGGYPFSVVRVPAEFEGDADTLGVVDGETGGVWFGDALTTVRVPHVHTLERVRVQSLPEHYGRWVVKSIGGLSRTVRREGTLKALPGAKGVVTLFATKAPTPYAVADAFAHSTEVVSVGDSAYVDEEHGHVTEVLVHEPHDLEYAAAVVARCGATPVLEDPELNARRSLSAERFDRIDCSLTRNEEEEDQWGPRRGTDNWTFGHFVPAHWAVPPLTWDHMVTNVGGAVSDVRDLPQPLRQHVCRARLRTSTDPEERRELRRHAPATQRLVSAALSVSQSKQGIECFYRLVVERATGDEAEAARLILRRYLLQRGYLFRHLGKYNQCADFTGNGKTFRRFARLQQYAPHRLPAAVLNRRCGKDGKLRGRGSKGSRSKYVPKAERYEPKRRLVRSWQVEAQMMAPPPSESS